MPVEIQSAWIQVIGTGLFTVLGVVLGIIVGRQLEKRDKKLTRTIITNHTANSIVNPKRTGPLSVSIDKEFLTNIPADKGTSVPVTKAYSFSVGVSNIGTDDIEKPEINITLSDDASIVQTLTESDHIPQSKIKVEKDQLRANYVRVTPDYINKQKGMVISIVSVGNSDAKCDIKATGLGVNHQSYNAQVDTARGSRRITFEVITALSGVFIAIVATLLSVFSFYTDTRTPTSPELQLTISAIQQTQITQLQATNIAIQTSEATNTPALLTTPTP